MALLDRLIQTFDRTEKRFEHRAESRHKLEELRKQGLCVNTSQVLKRIEYKGLSSDILFDDTLLRERTIGTDDLLNVNYLSKGVLAAKSVGRINVNTDAGSGYGTGFLIAPNIVITNNHVLSNVEDAASSYIEFNYEEDPLDRPLNASAFSFNPAKLFITNIELDFTIVYVDGNSINSADTLSSFGSLKLIEKTGKLQVGEKVSIIQHPNGGRKQVALRNNEVVDIFDQFIHYETDTEPGSSGSPVFNEEWEVVGLHHSGVPGRDAQGNILAIDDTIWMPSRGQSQIKWIANEGIRVSSIVKYLKLQTTGAQKLLLRDIIGFDTIDPEGNTTITTSYYNQASDRVDKLNYYQTIDFDSENLFHHLSTLLQQTHHNILSYKPSKFVYPEVDLHEDGTLRSIYSGESFTPEEIVLADAQIDLERRSKLLELTRTNAIMLQEEYLHQLDLIETFLPYNCEHVVPQSWFARKNPMKGDLHHLFTCESRCNSFRGNLAYQDFEQFAPEEIIREDCGMREEAFFEPERNKGIVARATLYYLLRYPNQLNANYTKASLRTLLEWHTSNDINAYELHRNQRIFALQGNRNPLIDYPELAYKIAFEEGL